MTIKQIVGGYRRMHKIRSDQKADWWLGQYSRSKTIENYAAALQKYCGYIGKCPTQLIEEA